MLKKYLRLPYLPIIVTPLALFSPALFTGKLMYWGTIMLQFVPWQTQIWHTLQAGELPLWNPLNGMGAPLIANYQTAFFYPPTWLYYLSASISGISGIAWAAGALVALHLIWGGIGMAKLAEKLGWNVLAQSVSGLAFGMAGYLVGRGLFPIMPISAAWLPWIMLAIYQLAHEPDNKKHLYRTALFIALQLLAGHAQTSWYILILAGVWLLYWSWQKSGWTHLKKTLPRYLGAGLFAGALTAIQLFPTAEYLAQSQRAAAVGFDFAMTNSFWPWRLLTLFAPNFFGSPVTGDYWGYATYWEDHNYIGLLALIAGLAALFRRGKDKPTKNLTWFSFGTIFVATLFALGDNTSVFPWLYRNIPTFNMFQAPSRYMLWATFALALMAGLGIQGWRRPEGRALYWSRLATMGAFAVAVGAGIGAWFFANGSEFIADLKPTFIPALAWAGFWGVGIGILNLLAPPKDNPRPTPRWTWAVVLWLSLDLLVSNWGLNPVTSADIYNERWSPKVEGRIHIPPDLEQSLKFDELLSFETFEINPSPTEFRRLNLPNANLLDGIFVTSNFDPLLPERYVKWMEEFGEDSPEMWARAGVEWVLTEDGLVELENKGERIYWTNCIEGPEQDSCSTDNKAGEVLWVDAQTNQITTKILSNDRGYLILADTYYPGWVAEVDGVETPIYPAETLFRGVKVPGGEHIITFTYKPNSFYTGAGISLIAWLVFIVLWRRENA